MDKDLNRWILEFLLRQPIPEDLIRRAISLLPLPNRDSRFKKTLLLRSIQASAISDDVLETLELVEELDRLDGVAVTDSMQVAYCAVAVCCTLDLVGDGEGEDMGGEYFAAVRRIWRSKVDKMEGKSGLFSNELGKWRDEIEAAVVDEDARRTLFKKKSAAVDHALFSVKSYLEEAWEIMGPSFLESAAKVMQGSSAWSEHADRERDLIRDSGDNDGGRIELGANQDVGERASSLHDPGQDLGGDGRDRVEVAPQLMNQQVHGVGDQQVAADMVKGDASLHESSQDLGGNKDDRLELAAKEINPGQVQGLGNKEVGDTVVKFHRKKHAARRRCISRRAQIVDTEDSDSDMPCTGNDPLPSPEVRQVQEALKSSNMELRAMVKDPLPDALKVSETVRCELQKKHMNDGPSIQNQNGADVVEEPIPDIERNEEPVQAEEANVINQKNSVRPSWMERNSTARTYEWDDSIDSDSTEGSSSKGRKRTHLCTPDRIVSSPLKNVNAAARGSKRRKKKTWSVVEEDTLRTGMHLYGKGNWKAILASYPGIFEERTCVDLKDKWRNMEKHLHLF